MMTTKHLTRERGSQLLIVDDFGAEFLTYYCGTSERCPQASGSVYYCLISPRFRRPQKLDNSWDIDDLPYASPRPSGTLKDMQID